MVLVPPAVAGVTATLSVAIIARDERRNLPRALASVSCLADETVVLDGGSTDGTPALARALGARVHHRAFDGFAAQKNAALDLCTGDFILVLDADETVPPACAAAIRAVLAAPDADGYALARRSLFLGRFMKRSGWFPDYTMRLVRRGRARFAPALVHESLAVDGPVRRLPPAAHLDHYTTETVAAHLAKMNRYTTLAALERAPAARRPGALAPPLLALFVFLKTLLPKQGFRDGREGFTLALLSAFYVFVKYWKFRAASGASGGAEGGEP